jgi:hypothetical protein
MRKTAILTTTLLLAMPFLSGGPKGARAELERRERRK